MNYNIITGTKYNQIGYTYGSEKQHLRTFYHKKA